MTALAAAPRTLTRWLLGAQWRSHRGRALVAILTIALGVGLGYAVQLINSAAFNEFSAAARSLSGQADLQLRGAQPFVDENIYPQLAAHEGVVMASPVLEVDAAVPGRDAPLKVLGIDVFRAKRVAPDLTGVPSADAPFDVLSGDAIFLSTAALQWLGARAGGKVALLSGTEKVPLRVAGGIARALPGQRIAVMDIAAVQTRFHMTGKLSRVDLQLARGVDRDAFQRELQQSLGARFVVGQTRDVESRTDRLSRAYRINMNVLALVALFTGAFLVFSTQAAGVVRRRAQFAMLRVLGMTRRQLVRQIMLEGALLGVVGAIIGIALGYAVAAVALRFFGSDLGGGYFPGVQPRVGFEPLATAIFLALGIGVALAGTLVPALEAARARPAPALKAGSEEAALTPLRKPWPALICLALGVVLTQVPPVVDAPIAGYLAVAFLLVGGIALMPRLTAIVFRAASVGYASQKNKAPRARGTIATLALARLANAPGQASIAMGGVLSSFTLIVAMAIMVASFRVSVEEWLMHLLSADLYVRMASSGDTGGLRPAEQAQLAATKGIEHTAFLRTSQVTLDSAKPPIVLIAREIDAADPGATLQMTGSVLPPSLWQPNETPVWASEATVDLYGYRVGERIALPVGAAKERFVIAGIWRDYVRQTGALQIRLADYRRITGDTTATDAGITLSKGVPAAQVIDALKRLPFGAALEFSQPGDIRARTLTIFDRSFAVTYLLEGVAIVIGLFGVGATFSVQTLARAREFGMLRHVGVTRGQILALLASEGGLLTLLGIAMGCVLGFAISLILVFIVNPQSFHWTMSLHVPWSMIAIIGCVMLASSCATAVLAGRRAVSIDAVRAVREDW
ncbi:MULTISPECIES: FtsX-like permease family protein [unclassified Caballeronia]|uniref:FtsX-like permease family protein n=1 Tax=unclassified Caballeronia TaxID=2646786 RepID=UPI00285710EE|nr:MULTISPECIES: FtsX-like permease family protein [unclassified Caballeronia]MDR5774688.1 FtsX-like permease family protein [Caballeronia sp. LZ002]MDR5850124.1 FtsX-like permease family protein [Caballeronia sp. LZ003]